jgi:hypothetical protein
LKRSSVVTLMTAAKITKKAGKTVPPVSRIR